jgi:hypothetical protein
MSLPPALESPYRDPKRYFFEPTVSVERARELADKRIRGRWTRPADGHLLTKTAAPRLVWVPYWRVAVGLRGRLLTSDIVVTANDIARTEAIPVDGVSGYAMVCARSAPVLLSFFATCEGNAPPWHVAADELKALDATAEPLGPGALVIDADVGPEGVHGMARGLCEKGLTQMVPGGATLLRLPDIETVITHFVLVPHFWVSYEYRGEAARNATEGFFVALHGRSELIVGESHPSSVRAVVGRIRRLVGLDPSGLR